MTELRGNRERRASEDGEPDTAATVSCFAALGDSFTAGTGCGPGRSWADRIAAALGGDEVTYRNLAVHGATSTEVRRQVGPALQMEPDLISVICGVNDLLFATRLDVLAYSRNLDGALRAAQGSLAGVRIFTATAPESWDFLGVGPRTRARIERDAVRLNQATRSIAAAHDIPLLEVAGDPGLSDPENFNLDGLHPSPVGHARAAREVAALLTNSFGLAIDDKEAFQ